MNRKDFLKGFGIAGLGLTVPAAKLWQNAANAQEMGATDGGCVLIPSETAGPFPLDLSTNTFYFRQDVREDRAGIQLNVKLRIKGLSNCLPMQNVRVNIWHCDKDGNYSGYGTEAALTYLRGYQITDSNGDVEFITIVPGWYNGRVCHIHFQVYVSSAYAAISQLTFNSNSLNDIYADNPSIYTKGADPLTPATDGIFSDGYALQLATLSPNATTGGYDCNLEVSVQGSGTVGMGYLEQQTAKQVVLQQNQPNPFAETTTIPFELKNASTVALEIWDISGKKITRIEKGLLPTGKHTIDLDIASLGLAKANYAYQLIVENEHGTFTDCKMMTCQKNK